MTPNSRDPRPDPVPGARVGRNPVRGSSPETPPEPPEPGERLASQESRLRLLVLHLAGRAVRARVEPEDLVQEVFLRALGARSGLPPFEPGEARLWRFLHRLARNTVVDVARAIRADKRSGPTVGLARSDWSRAGPRESQIAAPTPGPATRAAGAEASRRIEDGFAALLPEHRRVIGLRQLEGLSAREAARRMGRSETAVHSLYRRALAAWEGELEKSGDGGESGALLRP